LTDFVQSHTGGIRLSVVRKDMPVLPNKLWEAIENTRNGA